MLQIQHFQNMQLAVNAIAQSKHRTNKVAACLTHPNHGYTTSHANIWPPEIEKAFGHETKIGNSSGTVHAETTCILAAPAPTEGATIYITDPPCPNCMKNIVEAGIASIYIDHKGFEKDFALRRGESFENMSMRIAAKAGINIFKINRKEQQITPIATTPENYKPKNENPVRIENLDPNIPFETLWPQKIQEAIQTNGKKAIALCFATDKDNNAFCITTKKHATIGYTKETLENKCGKYSFVLQPLNRVLMNAARKGLTIQKDYIFSSRTPTSREFINFIGAGLNTLTISNKTLCRDKDGLIALKQLTKANTLTVK